MTPVTTPREFNDRLDELLASAREHDVHFERGWACRKTPDSLDYEVLISAVTPRDGDSEDG